MTNNVLDVLSVPLDNATGGAEFGADAGTSWYTPFDPGVGTR